MNKQGIGLWIVVCALLVLDIGVHCVRAQVGATPAKVLQVQELQILDSQGHVAIDLKAAAGKSGITLYDRQNRPRVLLTATDNGGRLNLADENKHPQLLLDGQWAPSVTLWQNDNLRMAMQAPSYDNDAFQIFDRAGKEQAYLGYQSSDSMPVSILSLHTDDAPARSVGMQISVGAANIGIEGADEYQRVGMDWADVEAPRLFVNDRHGKLLWQKKARGKEDTDGYFYLPPATLAPDYYKNLDETGH